MAGDKAILHGCEKNGTRRNAGFVFVRTQAHPEGEVIWFEGGIESSGMYIKYESEEVSAQGIDFKEAYTHYWLAEGVGTESFKWADFAELLTIPQLKKEIDAKDTAIAALTPPPLGIVQIWTGSKIPDGYALCDGTQYRQVDYPELYKVLGNTYNTAANSAGTTQTTTAGYFRIPDLRGRFIVGQSSVDNDYSANAKVGGVKTVALTISQMPSHVHSVDDYYYIERSSSVPSGLSGFESVPDTYGSGKTDRDNNRLLYKTHNTASVGNGLAHENRPPYYTLAYIMRMK
jgi:microcystin-dependent protein